MDLERHQKVQRLDVGKAFWTGQVQNGIDDLLQKLITKFGGEDEEPIGEGRVAMAVSFSRKTLFNALLAFEVHVL